MKIKLSDKIKDALSPEDLTAIESTMQKMVSEAVDLKVEEILKDIDSKADVFCEQEIAKKVDAEKEKLIEEYDGKLVELEESLVEKVDLFLESEINEQISDEAINKIAINETFAPIIEGIKKLFEEKYVALDSEGLGLVAEKASKIKELTEQNAKLIADKMELNSLVESASTKLILSEKTQDLTESQKERVYKFFEDKSFEEIEGKVDSFVELVSENQEDTLADNINEESNFSNDDGKAEIVNENKDVIVEDKEKDNINEEAKPAYSNTISRAQYLL